MIKVLQADKLTDGKDQDIQDKLKSIKKAIYEREFAKTIARPDASYEPIELKDIVVGNDYDGPKL